MTSYIVRRLFASVLILLGASFIVFVLTAYSGDPLQELRASNDPSKDVKIQNLTQQLNLNVPVPLRYFLWLGGASKCVIPFAGECDLGSTVAGRPVTAALAAAIPSTLQLVTAATVLAIVIGITVGVLTALRQYSILDYSVTFIAFLFFSLPVFWVAVLLKEFGAIGFNDFLADPRLAPGTIALIAVVVAFILAAFVGGRFKTRLVTFGVAVAATTVTLIYVSATEWFATPGLGPIVIGLSGAGIAVGLTALLAGLKNRRALYAALVSAGIGTALWFVLQGLLDVSTWGTILILAASAAAVSALIGYLMGGYDRSQSIKISIATSLAVGALIVLDRFMQAWPAYTSHSLIRNRPISTIGSSTPNLTGDMWITGIDKFTHLVLPTAAIILISLASYTRYSRASMLEVMGQDYVRTARAKGLPERVVITRHAFRNALIPLATIVAFDIGGMIGGAVITENVFAIPGMGTMFIRGVREVDPNPVMGVFLITGITAVVFNLIADLAYSALDPRVRVK